jgi:enoyl-CoA hydratase
MSDDVVLVDIADRVGVITLNRPDQRNALNRAIRRGLPHAINALEADDGVDVMILTGADPAFSAGVDLKEFGSGATTDAGEGFADMGARDDGRLPFRGALPPRTKPLIGAVNGVAVTGGLEVALNCDFLVASDRARFADTHARVGVMPGWGLTVLLPERIGVARAREMSLTGNYVDAATALQWGLVNHVVPHDELLPFARQLGADIVSNDQMGVRRMLRTYGEGTLISGEEAWVLEDRVSREWEGPGFDPASIEARRQKVIDRGRSQQH